MKRVLLIGLLAAVVVFAPFSDGHAKAKPHTLKQKLQVLDTSIVSVNFKDKDLKDICRFCTEFTGVNLIISPLLTTQADDYDLTVSLRLNEVSVRQLFSVILDLKGLSSVYRHGVIMITTPKDARGKPYMRIYNISDLTFRIRDFPGPDIQLRPSGAEWEGVFGAEEEGKEHAFADPEFIQDLILDNTGSGTWEDDGCRVSVNNRYMVVRTYRSVHGEIGRLLMLLRAFR